MSRRDTLKGIFDNTVEELAAANFEEEEEHRGPAGPVRSMALTLGRMEDEAKAMQEALIAGEHVQKIEPHLIDDSFVRDRLAESALTTDDEFVRSIAENGQEVPILVRRHPSAEGRYQVAYGHRRLRAARLLNVPVKAIVKPLSDADLVVAQGVENTARKNLSYIERAVFAHTLERSGFERPVIMKALTTDKTELSKLISVASTVPDDVIRAIGSAPAIGRRRWIAFADLWADGKLARLRQSFERPEFIEADSDQRFNLAMATLAGSRSASPKAVDTWRPVEGGELIGTIKADGKTYTLGLKAHDAAGFGSFLTERLDDLYREFKAAQAEK